MFLRSCSRLCLGFVAVAVLAGCPKEPSLKVSKSVLRFEVNTETGEYQTVQTFDVSNDGARDTTLVFAVAADPAWISVTPATGTSTGADDVITVTVTVDRDFIADAKGPGFSKGTVTVTGGEDVETIDVVTAPDYFTENFESGELDVNGLALNFEESGGLSFYSQVNSPITEFPTDPAGGFVLDFDAFGDPIEAAPFGDSKVSFYGKEYDTLYIGSEGWISFGAEGRAPVTAGDHFAAPQISVLPVDASGAGSVVSFLQDEDKLVITYEGVPSVDKGAGTNDFQVELFFGGGVRVSYVDVDPSITGVIGLSPGNGKNGLAPDDFFPSDLTGVNTAPLGSVLN